jgi:hypothetical protein
MVVPDRIGLHAWRRQHREKAVARRVARERAALQAVDHRAHESHDELPVVPSQGDLICFNAAIHPC